MLIANLIPSTARAVTETVSLEPSTANSLYASSVLETTPPEAPQAPLVRQNEPKVTTDYTDIRKQIADKFGTDAHVMDSIAKAESGYREDARNPHSTAKGLFQILDGSWIAYGCTGNVLNATDNINCAAKMKAQSGLSPWASSKSKWSTL